MDACDGQKRLVVCSGTLIEEIEATILVKAGDALFDAPAFSRIPSFRSVVPLTGWRRLPSTRMLRFSPFFHLNPE